MSPDFQKVEKILIVQEEEMVDKEAVICDYISNNGVALVKRQKGEKGKTITIDENTTAQKMIIAVQKW